MTNTYIVKPAELEAIALASSTEQTRYYLCGVLFERYKDATCGMIATDGHRAHAINAQVEASPVERFILDSDDVKKAIIMAKNEAKNVSRTFKNNIHICINKSNESLLVEIVMLDHDGTVLESKGSFNTKEIDGRFPDWRSIIPSYEASESAFSFNGSYMSDFAKAAKLLGCNMQRIKIEIITATSPLRVSLPINNKFIGVLMGVRI